MQTDVSLTRCILGTAGLGGVWGKIDEKESIRTVLMALEKGIIQIDTAPAYGDAEKLVGCALHQWKGVSPIISTKVGRLQSNSAHEGIYDYSPQGMIKSVECSLQTLGIEVIDVLFLHEPSAIPDKDRTSGIVEQMLEFKRKGYAKKIGIGGNLPDWFFSYASGTTFDVIMEYNRLDACCQDALNDSLPYSSLQGMEFYAASPLHMGLLGNRYEMFISSPPDWLDRLAVEKAVELNKIADQHQMALRSLSLRFLFSLDEDFKIVIGPSNTYQLCTITDDISAGTLPIQIVEEIMSLGQRK